MISVYDYGDASECGRQAAEETGFGCVGMNQVEVFAAEQPNDFDQGSEVFCEMNRRDQARQGMKDIGSSLGAPDPLPVWIAGQMDAITLAVMKPYGAKGIVLGAPND
jgi:hypothetical protein